MLLKRQAEELYVVEKAISELYRVDILDLRGKVRDRSFTQPRFLAWHVLYTRYNWSYPTIAEEYHRDHTSILNGVRRVRESADLRDELPTILEKIEELEKMFLVPRELAKGV